jgi:SAM-dependent methyltransferase
VKRDAYVAHYDLWAGEMQNRPHFYAWAVDSVSRVLPRGTQICDVGCGTGELLERLRLAGYRHLAGIDISPRLVEQTKGRGFRVLQLDIEHNPIPPMEAIVCTTVIDFLERPTAALRAFRLALDPGRPLLITFRNRDAYWPLYLIRHVLARLPGRLGHWALWLSTPLPMRRRDQPFERCYSLSEAKALVTSAGFHVERVYGGLLFPMLFIPDTWLERLACRLDRRTWGRRLRWHYELMFVCR